jgi:hypothetical protein
MVLCSPHLSKSRQSLQAPWTHQESRAIPRRWCHHIKYVKPLLRFWCSFANVSKAKPVNIPLHNHNFITPPGATPTQNEYNSNGSNESFAWGTSNAIPPLEADENFNNNSFDLSNAELEEMMINATQDFWASFPGEVGVGYQ